MAELRGFVFAVTFIVIFATLVSTIPAGLNGAGGTAENVTPVDAALVFGFAETSSYCKDNYTGAPLGYAYTLSGRDWLTYVGASLSTFSLGAKVYIGGILWLGGIQLVNFINENGTNRGNSLTATEIATDATDGQVKYDLVYQDNGNSAGGLVAYWNVTEHASVVDAWNEADATKCLWFMHGVGIEDTSINAVSLLLQMLTLSLPDVPVLLNAIIVTPLWAAIIYVIWFLIKESLPFV